MMDDPVVTCSRCGKPFDQNPITGERTCFVHGKPNGSELERRIWDQTAGPDENSEAPSN